MDDIDGMADRRPSQRGAILSQGVARCGLAAREHGIEFQQAGAFHGWGERGIVRDLVRAARHPIESEDDGPDGRRHETRGDWEILGAARGGDRIGLGHGHR